MKDSQESLNQDPVTFQESSPRRVDRMPGGLGNLRGESVFSLFIHHDQKAAHEPRNRKWKHSHCLYFFPWEVGNEKVRKYDDNYRESDSWGKWERALSRNNNHSTASIPDEGRQPGQSTNNTFASNYIQQPPPAANERALETTGHGYPRAHLKNHSSSCTPALYR